MKIRIFVLFVGLILFGFQSHGTMTLLSISGASNVDLSTPTKPIIYAGFTSGCVGDGTNVCDSCSGEPNSNYGNSRLFPCNKNNVYPNLLLTIQIQTTATGMTAANAYIKVGDSATLVPSTPQTFASGILTTFIRWSEICNHPSVGQTSACTGSFPTTLTIGLSATSGSTTTGESMSFTVSSKVVSTTGADATYTDCAVEGSAVTGSGFCHFQSYPGDGKIYADDLVAESGYPSSTAAGINYSNVVFFIEKQIEGEDDNTTISRITNASPIHYLGVSTSSSPPVADNRIDGLENNSRYCMIMANQDVTGVISYFTPPNTPASELCASPSEVVGLLDDKSCFIATAAFGSVMAPEVETFRQFRNHFLLTNSLGRSFVKIYYKYSPYYANLIAKSDVARAVVRGFLWPLLFLVQLSLTYGIVWTLSGMILLAGSFVLIYRRWTSGRFVRHGLLVFALLLIFAGAQKAVASQETDSAPQEAPYVQEDEFEDLEEPPPAAAEDLTLQEASPEEPSVELEPTVIVEKPASGKKSRGVEYIHHPQAAKGLMAITKDGTYIYKTKDFKAPSETGTLRFAGMDAPNIIAKDNTSYEQMYSGSPQPIILFDYEWHPFKNLGKFGVQAGFGILYAQGNGRFVNQPDTNIKEAKEEYTFVGIPLNLGLVYRLEWKERQWLAPYVAAGGTYIGIAEIRDDGKSPNIVGSPGVYGAGGVMFNISAINRETAFVLNSEYDIANLWITLEYRRLQTFNEELDFSSNIFGAGVSVDY